jgi:hypothetical protein
MDRSLVLEFARLVDSPVEKERSSNVMLRCPFEHMHPKRGKSMTLSVKVEPGQPSVANCFVCGISGRLYTGSQEHPGVYEQAQRTLGGFEMALKFLQEFDRGDFMSVLSAARSPLLKNTPSAEPSYQLERYVARCSRFVPTYLVEQRGIVRADVEKWRLGFDEKRNRAVFPVWNEQRFLVGSTGRSVLPDGVDPPRYKDYPPEFARVKTHFFYGEHLVDATLEHVYLCEGPLSVIYAARVLTNVLGMFGASTGVTPERLAKLRRWARKVTIIFDGDVAGREAVFGKVDPHGRHHEGLRDVLRQHFVVEVVTLPEGQDPASIQPDVLLHAVRAARYVI